jgi:hypothetical protein
MANKKISELEPGQQVVADTQLPGSLGAQTFKYTADQLAAYVQSKDTAGDIDGPLTGAEVVGIRGRSVSATEPTNGQILQWNGTAWIPVAAPAAAFTPVVYEYSNPVTNELLTIPTGATLIDIICIGAGAGGGSGRRGAAGTVRCGGGGGGSGTFSTITVRAGDIDGPLKVTVGAGGSGGTARTVDSTDGANGSPGTSSQVTSNTNAILCFALRGGAGIGGTTSSGPGGAAGTSGDFQGSAGNSASTSGGAGQDAGAASSRGPSGGGAGGGITSGNAASDGSSGQSVVHGQILVVNRGTVANPNASGGYSPLQGQTTGGGGGGGGASSLTGAGGLGGNGVRGGGGGGGGASVNGNNSGAGGNGGNGYVRIIFL